MNRSLKYLLIPLLLTAIAVLVFIFFPKKTGNNGIEQDLRRFPVGRSDEKTVAYWKTRKDLENPIIVLKTQEGTQEFQLPKEDRYDYLGNILFSPQKDFICIESGASGYWGYWIGRISEGKVEKLLSGPQYSYCLNWLKNNLILIKEQPYDEVKTNFYSYSTSTAEKELLFTKNIGW
ncbi:MAG: hypothetical protein WEC39_00950 [Patescibacteria group bacterium]